MIEAATENYCGEISLQTREKYNWKKQEKYILKNTFSISIHLRLRERRDAEMVKRASACWWIEFGSSGLREKCTRVCKIDDEEEEVQDVDQSILKGFGLVDFLSLPYSDPAGWVKITKTEIMILPMLLMHPLLMVLMLQLQLLPTSLLVSPTAPTTVWSV